MSVDSLFPEAEIVRAARQEFPPAWKQLLKVRRSVALKKVCDCIGLKSDSILYQAILSCQDLAVTVPQDPEDQNDPNLWALVIEVRNGIGMLFSFPNPKLNLEDYEFPIEYLRICRDLGLCHFSQYSGTFDNPQTIVEFGRQELLPMTTEPSVRHIEPFFVEGTGDYCCWINKDYHSVWYWDHETGEITKEPGVSDFVSWFEKTALRAWKL
jgi:hypothetical protein